MSGVLNLICTAMHKPVANPINIPIRSSFQITRSSAVGASSPRDIARITIVAAWPPVFPPAATTIGR